MVPGSVISQLLFYPDLLQAVYTLVAYLLFRRLLLFLEATFTTGLLDTRKNQYSTVASMIPTPTATQKLAIPSPTNNAALATNQTENTYPVKSTSPMAVSDDLPSFTYLPRSITTSFTIKTISKLLTNGAKNEDTLSLPNTTYPGAKKGAKKITRLATSQVKTKFFISFSSTFITTFARNC